MKTSADRRQATADERASGATISVCPTHAAVPGFSPYRRFAEKTEIISQVAAQGFVDLATCFRAATEPHAPGAGDRIVAVSQVYLGFALGQPALFRMMFSQKPSLSETDEMRWPSDILHNGQRKPL